MVQELADRAFVREVSQFMVKLKQVTSWCWLIGRLVEEGPRAGQFSMCASFVPGAGMVEVAECTRLCCNYPPLRMHRNECRIQPMQRWKVKASVAYDALIRQHREGVCGVLGYDNSDTGLHPGEVWAWAARLPCPPLHSSWTGAIRKIGRGLHRLVG